MCTIPFKLSLMKIVHIPFMQNNSVHLIHLYSHQIYALKFKQGLFRRDVYFLATFVCNRNRIYYSLRENQVIISTCQENYD